MSAIKRPTVRLRRCQLVAEAVAVLCPFCGEPQPNKDDGSEQWTQENFTKVKGRCACVSCDMQFVLSTDSKVQFR